MIIYNIKQLFNTIFWKHDVISKCTDKIHSVFYDEFWHMFTDRNNLWNHLEIIDLQKKHFYDQLFKNKDMQQSKKKSRSAVYRNQLHL